MLWKRARAVAPSRTRTIEDIVEQTGYLRNVTRVIGHDVGELHRQAFEVQLNTRGNDLAKRRLPTDMLNELAGDGFFRAGEISRG